MQEFRKLKTSKPFWKDLINPECFNVLEKKIETEKKKLDALYKNPSDFQEDPMFFLSKEKKILEEIKNFKKKKSQLSSSYVKAVDFLYDRINRGENEHYPYIFEDKDDKNNLYDFRLTFDFEELKNPDRKYYLEVSKNSSSSRYERIHISPDLDTKVKRTASDILA